jgi:hypothetical protein
MARLASAVASHLGGRRKASSVAASRVASALARRMRSSASKATAPMLASSVARRFASSKTHTMIASRVARGLASAVSRKLFSAQPGTKGLSDALASELAKRLGSKAADLPVQSESIQPAKK